MADSDDPLTRLAVLRRVYPPADAFVLAVLCRSDPQTADRCITVLERWITGAAGMATDMAKSGSVMNSQHEKPDGL